MNARRAVRAGAVGLLLGAVLWGAAARAGPAPDAEWPMLAHDAARSGATRAEVRPPFERKWYRLFPDEGLMAGVQPIVAGGKVFVGTLAGKLHAIDDATGKDAWVFQAGGAILHAAAAADGRVFFGAADGKVYALDAATGKAAWTVATGAAVWNAPAVHEGLVLVGSRDGKLYAIGAADGRVRWASPTGGPILSSPAVDAKAGRAVVGSEDMHVYAFDLRDGKQAWQSPKLPGASLRGYHPVVAPDGAVLVTAAPAMSLDDFSPVLEDMVKEIFGDMASWRHKEDENKRLREENLKKLAEPGTYDAELAYLRKRLADEPAYQTFFVLDGETGRQRFVAPVVYAESMNGPGAPPLVTPDGKVLVKYQALLRSRYGHYSPFLNVGYLDTKTGHIAPVMDPSRTYGWHDSLLLVHDEQCQLSVAGRVLLNAHQDNVNAMDLETLAGYAEPFCRGIHEPKKGEAIAIGTYILRDRPVPAGKEWLARGTAVYGGGSAIDTAVSVAGDTFYYVPTHEINAGAVVIAYRMQAGGTAGKETPPPTEALTEAEWQKVRQMPWDWDILATPRLRNVLEALPGKVPGTRQDPLVDAAAAEVAKIKDADLDRVLWEARVPGDPAAGAPADLKADLARQVGELVSQTWRPLVFPAGKHPTEAYRFFIEPTETLYTLARAYPYLDADLQAKVRAYVAALDAPGGPLAGRTGRPTFPRDAGAERALYGPAPERLMRIADDLTRSEVARLYPLWLWAHATGDWARIERSWKDLKELVGQGPNQVEEDCRNGYVAGLIAYCRTAARVGDGEAVREGAARARQAMRDRLAYEFTYPRGGVMSDVPVGRTIFSRWRHLVPEVGRLCGEHARPITQHLVGVYLDYHRPTWWLAWNVELMWRNESPLALPTMSAEAFAARALILEEPAARLAAWRDIPWCRADLFYVQKTVLCLEAAAGGPAWQDVRKEADR